MYQLPLFDVVTIPPDSHNPNDFTSYVIFKGWNGVNTILCVPCWMEVLYATQQ